MSTNRPRVVIIGAGFGGITLAETLSNDPFELLIVDRHNYHTFQPLLYQVATAGLGSQHVAQSVRDIFHHQSNVNFRMNTVQDVDFEAKQLKCADETSIDYDYLVVAAGASANFFGIEGASEHAIPVKNLSNAVHLRSHILSQFETADRYPGKIDEGLLNFVVVGGGPTGVETAGALTELFDHVLSLDYSPSLVDHARVVMIEMMPSVLGPYDSSLQDYAQEMLESRGVEVKLETTVDKVTENTVYFEETGPILTRTLIWAAGVKANPLAGHLGVEQTRAGRIVVDDTLRIPEFDQVFAIGDIAGATDSHGDLLPQLAPVAIQQGKHVAAQIKTIHKNSEINSFEYDHPGQMATIGRNHAVAELPNGFKLKGFTAWIIWVFLHVAKLIGFRHKVMVFLSWVYNYFTFGSSSRIILDPGPESDEVIDTEETT